MTLKPNNAARHFFLVDDDHDDQEIFVDLLSDVTDSITVTRFNNGNELIEALCLEMALMPEVIFLDLRMPKRSGLDCLADIRKLPEPINLLNIVIFTAIHYPNTIVSAFRLGATFYVIKPLRYDDYKSFVAGIAKMDWAAPTLQEKDYCPLLISPLHYSY